MNVTIICSNKDHPVYPYLIKWIEKNCHNHSISILTSVKSIQECGDILFLVSCSEIVKQEVRDKFRYTLVLHASDLPLGRGWSPHIWDILGGSNELTLSLLSAEDGVDTGDIWQKRKIPLDGTELFDDINQKLFKAELELMTWACENIDGAEPIKQENDISSYYRKRTPADSELDLDKSLRSQFNLLRVCDSNRFPAYLSINGQKYNIKLEKADD